MPTPYTIAFGPWAPDLANNGVQLSSYASYQNTPVPVADVLNVYYQDGSYRCLPAPASIGPALGVAAVNATDWYDDSTGKQSVFAGSSGGLWMLVDGAWSAVPIQTNASAGAIGQLISLNLGAPVCLAFSPDSQARSGTSPSYLFPVEDIEGVPAGIGPVWSVSAASGGTWSVADGQGSNVSQAQVTGVSAGTTASANYGCTVTIQGVVYSFSAALSYGYMAGSISGNATGDPTNSVTASAPGGVAPFSYAWSVSNPAIVIASPTSATTTFSGATRVSGSATCTITDANGTQVAPSCTVAITPSYSGTVTVATGGGGSLWGFDLGGFGSISPSADDAGNSIEGLYMDSSGGFTLRVASNQPQNYFGTLIVNGGSLASASASWGQSGGVTQWYWSTGPAVSFVAGNTYAWSYS